MYIAQGQGQTTPWEQTFDVNRKPLSLCPFAAGVQKNCYEVPFYIHLFHVSPYVYSPRQGQTIHWGQNFDENRKAFSLCPYVASFKMISLKLDFIHIFNDFIHFVCVEVLQPSQQLRSCPHLSGYSLKVIKMMWAKSCLSFLMPYQGWTLTFSGQGPTGPLTFQI